VSSPSARRWRFQRSLPIVSTRAAKPSVTFTATRISFAPTLKASTVLAATVPENT
jgi:hypothetical protein